MPGVICPSCGHNVDGGGPAVVNDFGKEPRWAPFVEDLRSSPHEVRHPVCFAQEAGVDRLVELVHANDDMMRRESFRNWKVIQDLKGKLDNRP